MFLFLKELTFIFLKKFTPEVHTLNLQTLTILIAIEELIDYVQKLIWKVEQ